jgi:hypothetical protein
MLIQALQLAVVAWLPGAAIYHARWSDRNRRAQLDPEERLFWAVIISIAISLSAVITLAWLGRYSFTRLLIADVVIAACVASLSRFDLRLGGSARWPGLSATLPLALIILGLWRFFPPAEFVIGGKDPGVYVNEGIQIAQRGTFLYEDPVVSSIPAFARDLFFPSHQRPEYYSLRFMGFRIMDPDEGLVVGQFPHLLPAAIAVAYGIDGLTGTRRTTGVFAILGLLAVYFVGARLFGRTVGFAAAVLLALNLVQVWFARYPNVEVVMQALLFAALLATARAHVDDDGFFAPVAGGLLGLLLFLRAEDTALAIVAVVTGIALLVMAGSGRWRWSFLGTLAAISAVAAIYLALPMRAYADRGIVFISNLQWWQYLLIAAATAAVPVLLTAARSRPSLRARVRVLVPIGLALAVIVAAVYAMWFRKPAGRLAYHDAYALRTFTQYYLTLPALIAALVGFAFACRRLFWRAPALFTTVAAFSLFLFYKIRIVPDHFWMARRFLPEVLPAALLFTAAAALGTRTGRRWTLAPRWALGLVFLTLLGREYARASSPILDHVEYAGVIPRLEQLASIIGANDLLIVESRNSGTDVHTLGLPLAYIYARNVLILNSPVPDKPTIAAFLQWAEGRYARVLFVGAGGTDLLSREWSTKVVASDRFQVPEYVAAPNEYPRYPRVKQFDYTIYEFTPPAADENGRDFVLDIGVGDDLNVLRFHAKEDTEGHTFRWSQAVSYVVLPDLHAANREVTIWMSDGGRPPAAPPAEVVIALDDRILGTVQVNTGFSAYTVEIPAELAASLAARKAPVRLKLTTQVWRPGEALGTSDDRELGIMVDRVAVK